MIWVILSLPSKKTTLTSKDLSNLFSISKSKTVLIVSFLMSDDSKTLKSEISVIVGISVPDELASYLLKLD